MRVNGLYGHVRSNDVRSLALFASFIGAFHILAAMALLMPLAMFDPEHAPVYGWAGYLLRWMPIVTIVGVILFAVQMAWHVSTVRQRMSFHFVDSMEEPRLCRIVEPLAVAAGLPTPYVGVIESPALNAFACGIRRKDAVLVFTRGLVDGLDDEELAAVAAHEIAHIVNGDIRLIAAANVCLDTLKLLNQRREPKLANRIVQALTLPILAVVLPLMVVLVLVVSFLRRLTVDGSQLARLMIASAREFIADAEAVQLTQNPAALVSALRRIEGRSAIPGLAAGQDAMMIDGVHEGAMATHPTISARIGAITKVTGSMAFVAPSRRDTRPSEVRVGGGFGRRRSPVREAAPLPAQRSAVPARASAASGLNRLGLTREMTVGAVLAIGAFAWAHGADIGKPGTLAKVFDSNPTRKFFAMAGKGVGCQMQGIAWAFGMAQEPTDCGELSMEGVLADFRGGRSVPGLPADQQSSAPEVYVRSNGTFSSIPPPAVQLAEVRRDRCYQTDPYSVGDLGLHSVSEQPVDSDAVSLKHYLAVAESKAVDVNQATSGARDKALLDYFAFRKLFGQVIHRSFGEPGLAVAKAHFSEPAHQDAIAALRQRLADPGFAPGLSPVERAQLELLAADPLDFVSCTTRRTRAVKA